MDEPKRRVKVDMSELEEAFDSSPDAPTFYLDLETGEVPMVTEEMRDELDKVYEELEDGEEAPKRRWPRPSSGGTRRSG
ncbi:MAG: hypothetical protein M0Z94_02655 [Dehalococcoidales bacterium]|nr:hypothetical protein [Dehalococcoidales bacterium]